LSGALVFPARGEVIRPREQAKDTGNPRLCETHLWYLKGRKQSEENKEGPDPKEQSVMIRKGSKWKQSSSKFLKSTKTREKKEKRDEGERAENSKVLKVRRRYL